MTDRAWYVGFDLGTTNSAAAVFDGEELTVVRSVQGGVLTPSVVRINKNGAVSVGAKARRYLERDPDNTHSEFKRLMGTAEGIHFKGASVRRKAEELSAEVLSAMCSDVEAQLGFRPTRAVVTVPALFEIPQSAATTKAAALAGLDRIELLQEPVASALAAGWTADDAQGPWLVYDLGGGTFDVSLLETRHGLLRVVGHDGDNFLGGRDFDRVIVDWAIERLAEEGHTLSRENPDHREALRVLALAAEEAKIELSRTGTTTLALPDPLEVDDQEIDVELALSLEVLEREIGPLVERSIDVCERLLKEHGVSPEQLQRVVLVGGPTVTPLIRKRVRESVGPLAADALDPMTLVAQGAALYAASAGLDARPQRVSEDRGQPVRLQYPTMTADPSPFVVGRLVKLTDDVPIRVRLLRQESHWESPWATVDHEGAFVLNAEVMTRRANTFLLDARDASDAPVALSPGRITIVHGVAITDPPLSRTIGVALANDAVRVYFERGTPLPSRRTFVHHTVETVAPGVGAALRIPIVQGELDLAHLCRLVGTLEIPADDLPRVLPVGSDIEVSLELDRGGHLSARAMIPSTGQVFEEVAHLLVPDASVEVLEVGLKDLNTRLNALEFGDHRGDPIEWKIRIHALRGSLETASKGVAATRGGDADAGQRTRRTLLECEGEIASMEAQGRWPQLEAAAMEDIATASQWVSQYGTDAEKRLLDQAIEGIERARAAGSARDMQRQLRVVQRLRTASFYRHPDAWAWNFEHVASRAHEASDVVRAEALVQQGKTALAAGDTPALRSAVEELSGMLPGDVQSRQRSFLSGVR